MFSYKVQNEKQRKKPTTNRKHVWLLHTFLETLCATYAWDYGANPGSSHTQQCACGDSSSILKKPWQKAHLGSPRSLHWDGWKAHGLRDAWVQTNHHNFCHSHCSKHKLDKNKKQRKRHRKNREMVQKRKNLCLPLRVICTPAWPGFLHLSIQWNETSGKRR